MAGGAFKPGFNPHLPGLSHRLGAKMLGASMWFFLMYRMRADGKVLLGMQHPWDH